MDYEIRTVHLRKDYHPENVAVALTHFTREAETYEKLAGTVSDVTGKIQLQAGEQVAVRKQRFNPRTVAARLARQYGLEFFSLHGQIERIADGIDFTEGEIRLLSEQIETALGDPFRRRDPARTRVLGACQKGRFPHRRTRRLLRGNPLRA